MSFDTPLIFCWEDVIICFHSSNGFSVQRFSFHMLEYLKRMAVLSPLNRVYPAALNNVHTALHCNSPRPDFRMNLNWASLSFQRKLWSRGSSSVFSFGVSLVSCTFYME